MIMTPCDQKENIEKLFDLNEARAEKLHTIELRQIEIQGLVLETKKKIENGITHKIDKTHDIVIKLEPIIAHHDKVVNNIETMGWWISRILLASLIGVLFWAISKGFMPKV
jgi:hypothetical protein